MSQSADPRQPAHDPRRRQRSDELMQLLAHCPEHLFSTDDDELAPIDMTMEPVDTAADKPAALEKAA